MFSTADTIVAIATPPGVGALGVVRLSGPRAHDIALELLARRAPLAPRRATFGRVHDLGIEGTASTVDHVVATRYIAPHSFTGDDVVEMCGHGSMLLLRQITSLAVQAGARLAEPGEFTFRAFVNGRLDLVQAEAIRDLVAAVTPLQARSAMDQLEGTLTGAIQGIDAALFDLMARLEASLDFPDEGFHFIDRAAVAAELGKVRQAIDRLVREGRAGRVIREGSLVVICGRPNAGKSSLFNALVGASRAIVTDMPGTTRDLVTERVDIDGLDVTLVDTAGLRDAQDAIEAEGVKRTREAQEVAALTLVVADGSRSVAEEDRMAAATIRGSWIGVLSKSDLGDNWNASNAWPESVPRVRVSAVTGEGLDELRRQVVRRLTQMDTWRDPPAVSNLRHLAHLEDARDALDRALGAVEDGASEELVLAALAPARDALECVTGRRAPDDLLHHIFARFCLGK